MKRILISEDKSDLQTSIQDYGYQTLTASNGREAFEMALRERPDLILLDISAPGSYLDGIAACRCIKSNRVTSNIPIVMISADNKPYVIKASELAGANELIYKPLHPATLISRLQTICANAKPVIPALD